MLPFKSNLSSHLKVHLVSLEIIAAEKISYGAFLLCASMHWVTVVESLKLPYSFISLTYSDFEGTFLPHPVSCFMTQQNAINPLPAPLMPVRKALFLLVGVAQSWLLVVFNRNYCFVLFFLNDSKCYRINDITTALPVTLSENHFQQCIICICTDLRFSCSASITVSHTCMYAPNEN